MDKIQAKNILLLNIVIKIIYAQYIAKNFHHIALYVNRIYAMIAKKIIKEIMRLLNMIR